MSSPHKRRLRLGRFQWQKRVKKGDLQALPGAERTGDNTEDKRRKTDGGGRITDKGKSPQLPHVPLGHPETMKRVFLRDFASGLLLSRVFVHERKPGSQGRIRLEPPRSSKPDGARQE